MMTRGLPTKLAAVAAFVQLCVIYLFSQNQVDGFMLRSPPHRNRSPPQPMSDDGFYKKLCRLADGVSPLGESNLTAKEDKQRTKDAMCYINEVTIFDLKLIFFLFRIDCLHFLISKLSRALSSP